MEEQENYIDEVKELDGSATDSPEVNVEGQSVETPASEPTVFKVGDQEFTSIEDIVSYAENTDKSYKNLQELNGKQTNELGDLRKSLEEIKVNTTPKEVETQLPEYDPYDVNTVLPHISQLVKKEMDAKSKIQEHETAKRRIKDSQQTMIDGFIEKHPDLSNEELTQIAQFGDQRGIALIDDAYTLLTMAQERKKAKSEGVKEVTDKLTQADSVPTTLSNATGGNETAIDFDAINQTDWNGLSDKVRMTALMQTPAG
jgi:hypothetical protein